MIKEIRNLIETKLYSKALDLIEKELASKVFDFNVDNDSAEYSDLISLRITAKTLLSQYDDIVLHITRKEKYPYIKTIKYLDNRNIYLIDQNIFLFKCDAWVNSIHKEKYFNYSLKSFSHILAKRIGEAEVNKQIEKFDEGNNDGYVKLDHPDLLSPMSFHIPMLFNSHKVDFKALEKGLKSILEKACSLGLETIGIAPLGMGGNRNEKMNNEFTEEEIQIVKTIAKVLEDFFNTTEHQRLPKITFAFINYRSFQLFEKILIECTPEGRSHAKIDREVEQIQIALINKTSAKNEKFKQLLNQIAYSVNENDPILLLGESGVGKSFLAKIIHEESRRFDGNMPYGNFADINLAALSGDTTYSELFGHIKGAFTGANKDAPGIFGSVERGTGTIFLDEVGYAERKTQVMLLKFLDTGEYTRLGDTEPITADVRLIFGTNHNLETLVREKLFIPELYARIMNSFKFTIPPLKDRTEDIELLVRNRLKELNDKKGSKISMMKYAGLSLREMKKCCWGS